MTTVSRWERSWTFTDSLCLNIIKMKEKTVLLLLTLVSAIHHISSKPGLPCLHDVDVFES